MAFSYERGTGFYLRNGFRLNTDEIPEGNQKYDDDWMVYMHVKSKLAVPWWRVGWRGAPAPRRLSSADRNVV